MHVLTSSNVWISRQVRKVSWAALDRCLTRKKRWSTLPCLVHLHCRHWGAQLEWGGDPKECNLNWKQPPHFSLFHLSERNLCTYSASLCKPLLQPRISAFQEGWVSKKGSKWFIPIVFWASQHGWVFWASQSGCSCQTKWGKGDDAAHCNDPSGPHIQDSPDQSWASFRNDCNFTQLFNQLSIVKKLSILHLKFDFVQILHYLYLFSFLANCGTWYLSTRHLTRNVLFKRNMNQLKLKFNCLYNLFWKWWCVISREETIIDC